MSRNYSVRISLVFGLLTVAFVLWVLFDRQNPQSLATAAASSNAQQHVKNTGSLSNQENVTYFTAAEAKAKGLNLSTVTGEVISSAEYIACAQKYGLAVDDAKMLMSWMRSRAFTGGDYEQKATRVGIMCLKYKITKRDMFDIIGPGIQPNSTTMYYTYFPGHSLFFTFNESGALIRARASERELSAPE